MIAPPPLRYCLRTPQLLSPFVDLKHCCNESDMAIRQLKQPVSYRGAFRLCLCPSCWACWDDYKEPNVACFISIPSESFFWANFDWLPAPDTLMSEHNQEVLFSVCYAGMFYSNSTQKLIELAGENMDPFQFHKVFYTLFHFTQFWRGSGNTRMIRDSFLSNAHEIYWNIFRSAEPKNGCLKGNPVMIFWQHTQKPIRH